MARGTGELGFHLKEETLATLKYLLNITSLPGSSVYRKDCFVLFWSSGDCCNDKLIQKLTNVPTKEENVSEEIGTVTKPVCANVFPCYFKNIQNSVVELVGLQASGEVIILYQHII